MIIDNRLRKYINSNFRIRLYGKNECGVFVDRLLGVSGLCAAISEHNIKKCIAKLIKLDSDKLKIKIYNSYTIVFTQK